MSKKLVKRGRHTVLPITPDILVELQLGQMTTLVFRAGDGSESELRIEDRIVLSRGTHELVLEGSKMGESFNPRELGPLLELLGCEVEDAIAEHDGLLSIRFSNQLTLAIRSTTGYEAWHFQSPRPGRPAGGPTGKFVGLSGGPGRLL